ncbi:MAG: carbohydrate porin [Candidatus Omnitrophica bacterium]|nr:carbohydrate porin [Candidatus Omnitrophota bacterium]MDD5653288.1 carbohydrate porin [Candidatus Omnitrophota bacterium]
MAVIKKFSLLLLIGAFFCNPVLADEVSIRDEIKLLKERIQALEKKVSEQDTFIATQNTTVKIQAQQISDYEIKFSQFEEKLKRAPSETMQIMEGLELGAGLTMVVQGANNVNNSSEGQTQKRNRTDGSYSADITLAKEFKEFDSRAFLHLEGGQGDGVEDDLILYSNVNRDADNHENVRVTELWYEQGLFKDKAALAFGKLDPTVYFDQNEVANDETTQFLGRMFRNSATLEFPDNTAGLRIAVLPKDWVELGYGMFNGNSDNWSKMFDNLFNIGQITLKTNFSNLAGNYRFYGWNNNLYHTKWLDSEKAKEAAYGFGLSFDQKVSDIVTLFVRYGWQDPKVYNPDLTASGGLPYSLEQSWSAGLQVEGKPWGREKDILAFAIGQAFPSGDYKEYYGFSARPEGHIESYYKLHLNDHLSLSPDLQYIWNAFGKDVGDDPNNVFVGGMRAQMEF